MLFAFSFYRFIYIFFNVFICFTSSFFSNFAISSRFFYFLFLCMIWTSKLPLTVFWVWRLIWAIKSHYIAMEDKAALKIRHMAWHSQKCEVKELKVGDSEEKSQTLMGRHWSQGREKLTKRHRVSRAFNQDMGNQKANLTMPANSGSFTSHQMTVCKMSMTNTKTG